MFETESKRKIFCSEDCQYNSNKRKTLQRQKIRTDAKPKLPEKVCDICGTAFIPMSNKQKRCSATCSNTYRRKYALDFARKHKDKPKAATPSRAGNFKCPKCGNMHDDPLDADGHQFQYCTACRKYFQNAGYPADDSVCYNVASTQWEARVA